MGSELEAIISLAVIGVIVMILLTAVFSFLSNYLNEVNEAKERETRLKKYQQEADEALLEQSKAHKTNYPEDFAKRIKETDKDFKVDFNIELAGSIVKTEVVYAE